MRSGFLLLLTTTAILLVACGSSPNAPGAGGLTKAQADELNQAAAGLDARSNQTVSAQIAR